MRGLSLFKRPFVFVRNVLRADEPWDVRLLQAADRLLARLERRQGCCGHYGEPGC